MNTFDVEFSFSELQLNLQDLKNAAPDGGQGLDDFEETINALISSGASFVHAQGGYSIASIQFDTERNSLKLWQDEDSERFCTAGTSNTTLQQGVSECFEVGEIITRQLAHSEKALVFACTAGSGISQQYDAFVNNDDLLNAYLVDILGSASVEKAMDLIQNRIQEQMAAHGLKITNRYSPGYCGWNVSEQHKLFRFLPPHYCGITLTSTALMQPIKSVSGIIGVGKNVRMQEYTCGLCQLGHCLYRKKRS